jgi:hypothetical protein
MHQGMSQWLQRRQSIGDPGSAGIVKMRSDIAADVD